MIDKGTRAAEILVIDDNAYWLKSLEHLGIRTVCCQSMSYRNLVTTIASMAADVSILIINKHLVQTTGINRVHNHGLFLKADLLEPRFAGKTYRLLTFGVDETGFDDYLEFIGFVNNNFYEQGNNS